MAIGNNVTLSTLTTGIYNTALGGSVLKECTSGSNNVGVGLNVFFTGNVSQCTGMGNDALQYSGAVTGCTAMGYQSCLGSQSDYNTGFGWKSLNYITSGANNTACGAAAGFSTSTASGCVYLGYQAGYNNNTSNKLYIANSNTATPLILGDFSTPALTINGTLTATGTITGNLSGNATTATNLSSTATDGYVYSIIAGVPSWAAPPASGVSSIAGTLNQITASAATGAVTLSLPSAITCPGSLQSTTYLKSTTYGSIGSYLEVGGTATTTDLTAYFGRVITASTATCRGLYSISNIISAAGASLAKVYGFQLVDVLSTNALNLNTSSIYGISSEPTLTPIDTVAAEYGIYSNPIHLSGTVTALYGGYFDVTNSGGTVTKSCALYATDGQIGGSILTGSSKTGFLYIENRLGIGGSTNNADRTLNLGRSYTMLNNLAYAVNSSQVLTVPSGAAANDMTAWRLADSLVSNTSNTSNTFYQVKIDPAFTGTPTTIANAYALRVDATGSGTVTNMYGGYFATPTAGTNRMGLYCESFQCGGTIPAAASVVPGRPFDKTGYLVPVGTVILFVSNTIPQGWLLCDGTAYARGTTGSTYNDLWLVIGTSYGNGDGSTTFNVPNMKGCFPRGRANGSANDPDRAGRTSIAGSASGDNVGSNQTSAFQTHVHTFPVRFAAGSVSNLNSARESNVAPLGTDTTNAPSTGTTSTETRPINIYFNFIIKY